MSSPSLFILLHLPSKTYYGIRRNYRYHRNTNTLPLSTDNVYIRPVYNIVGFERFQDAIIVADSIATHRIVHRKNPNEHVICLYPESQILVDAVEHDLWVTETKLSNLKRMTKNRNIGVQIVYDIKTSDKGDLVVQFKELDFENDRYTNYDFIDTLEKNLDLK